MNLLVVVLLAAVFTMASCAAPPIPPGQAGFVVDCPSAAPTWSACHEKAAQLCARGYAVAAEIDAGTPLLTASHDGGEFGGITATRTLLIVCR